METSSTMKSTQADLLVRTAARTRTPHVRRAHFLKICGARHSFNVGSLAPVRCPLLYCTSSYAQGVIPDYSALRERRRNASHPPLIDVMRRLPPRAECNRCPNGPKSRGFCRIFFHPSQLVLPCALSQNSLRTRARSIALDAIPDGTQNKIK